MKEIDLILKGPNIDFNQARKLAKQIAKENNPETLLVAWCDKGTKRHSPSIVCEGGDLPG